MAEIVPTPTTNTNRVFGQIEFLAYAVSNVSISIDNIINLITVRKIEDAATTHLSVPLLLSALHGIHLQVEEIAKYLQEPHRLLLNETDSEWALHNKLKVVEEQCVQLQHVVKTQQERLQEFESQERQAGLEEKIRRQEHTIELQNAKIAYYEELENKLKKEKKRSKKRRRDMDTLRYLASESVASKIDRSNDECNGCAFQNTKPPVCSGHIPGEVCCALFVPKDIDLSE